MNFSWSKALFSVMNIVFVCYCGARVFDIFCDICYQRKGKIPLFFQVSLIFRQILSAYSFLKKLLIGATLVIVRVKIVSVYVCWEDFLEI